MSPRLLNKYSWVHTYFVAKDLMLSFLLEKGDNVLGVKLLATVNETLTLYTIHQTYNIEHLQVTCIAFGIINARCKLCNTRQLSYVGIEKNLSFCIFGAHIIWWPTHLSAQDSRG